MPQTVTHLSNLQGGDIEGLEAKPLESHSEQMVMTTLAAVAMNAAPIDLVATDGTHFTLYRMRGPLILMYQNLTATRVGASASAAAAWCCQLCHIIGATNAANSGLPQLAVLVRPAQSMLCM